MSAPILTKTLRDGSACTVNIVPDPIRPGDEASTLSWYIEVYRDGQRLCRMSTRPRKLATPQAGGLTHALPVDVRNAKSIGLTGAEAQQITTGIDEWVSGRKRANRQAREDLAAQVRAAAPAAPTRTIISPHGVPGVGETERLADGRIVTSLRTWHRYYREDGMTFGADDDAGYVYYAEVRAATEAEVAPLLQREAAQRARHDLLARVEEEIVTPATRPEDAAQIPDLLTLPGVKLGPLVELRKGTDSLWVLRYNGADGDNWAYNNYRSYIVRRAPLTTRRSDLFAKLTAVVGAK